MTNGILWFLLALFLVKCLYAFTRKWKPWAITVLSVFSLMLTVILKQNGLDALPWYLHSMFFAYPFFMFGVAAKSTGFLSFMDSKPIWTKLIVAVVCLGICYLVSEQNGRMSIGSITYGQNVFLCLVTGLLGTLGVICISQTLHQGWLLKTVGKGTITILALQDPLILIIYLLSKICLGVEGAMPLWIAMLEATFVVLLCMPVFLLLERYCPVVVGKRITT